MSAVLPACWLGHVPCPRVLWKVQVYCCLLSGDSVQATHGFNDISSVRNHVRPTSPPLAANGEHTTRSCSPMMLVPPQWPGTWSTPSKQRSVSTSDPFFSWVPNGLSELRRKATVSNMRCPTKSLSKPLAMAFANPCFTGFRSCRLGPSPATCACRRAKAVAKDPFQAFCRGPANLVLMGF